MYRVEASFFGDPERAHRMQRGFQLSTSTEYRRYWHRSRRKGRKRNHA
ncbi:Protein of unknown function [Pyronema omphalodes CBS 100304]|uniref:Uncharacterized protein n=1 Tax=Pyronema omphalodes (strain CBS 100304) TaxID=1076935 RepID=U4L1P2_PYROM|nr:Protein of unknown function [Pyronema omphalodes CBS 100304]